MRIPMAICAAFLVSFPAASLAQVSGGVSFDSDGVDSFYLAVGDHYRVPKSKVVYCRKKRIPDEHLPVVFFLAREAEVEPETIVSLRVSGKSWMEIAVSFGVGAEVFYVAVDKPCGPPYGRALGHYKGKKRSEWHSIRLSDADVVSLVGLKFLASRHRCSADAILELHRKGDSLVKLDVRIKEKRGKGKGGGNDGVRGTKKSSRSDKSPGKEGGRGGGKGKKNR